MLVRNCRANSSRLYISLDPWKGGRRLYKNMTFHKDPVDIMEIFAVEVGGL